MDRAKKKRGPRRTKEERKNELEEKIAELRRQIEAEQAARA